MKSKSTKVSKKKASSVKHANKRYSKLQKRGKIKNRHKTLKNGTTRNVPETETNTSNDVQNNALLNADDETDVLDMIEQEDMEFLNNSAKSYSFLSRSLDENPNKKQKTFDRENEELDYEKVPRTLPIQPKERRPLLPLKNKHGLLLQSMEIPSSDEEDELEDDSIELNEKEEEESTVKLTAAELYAQRQKHLNSLKLKVASLSNIIIENPEKNMKSLKELRLMLDNSKIGFIGYKMVLMSLLEVFKDIIPGYQIVLNAEDKNHKLKKDTKQLLDYEQAMVRNYQYYLKRLEQLLRGMKGKLQKSNSSDSLKKSSMILGEIAVTCFCELLAAHPHFNFTKTIISLVVPYMASEKKTISSKCCNSVKSVFKNDKLGETSLEIVKHITKLVKTKNFNVEPEILNTFLALKLKDANLNSDEKKQDILSRKEWYKKYSRKERKFKKRMAGLDKELLEVEAEESKQKKSKYHTETVKLVFLCYFRVLKLSSNHSLLPSVLEGLSKFAHLINVDFFDDLINVLFSLVDSEELTYKENLYCAKTVFTILSGQGETLNIDPQNFYSHLYHSSLCLDAGNSSEDTKILLDCIEMTIIQRRKKVTLPRILAFMKRLTTISLHLLHNGSLACLAYVRMMLLLNRTADILLDPDCSSGSGNFQPELPNPDHCNAQSTSMWELHFLSKHYHPTVRKFSTNIMHGAPIQGNGQLPIELTKLSPIELYDEHDSSSLSFKPSIPYVKKKSSKKLKSSQGELELKAMSTLDNI